MRTQNGIEYYETPDLAELWGIDKKVLSKIIYKSSGMKGIHRFPTPDIKNSRRQYWKSSRIGELDEWWNRHNNDEVKEIIKEEPSMGYAQKIHNPPVATERIAITTQTPVPFEIKFVNADEFPSHHSVGDVLAIVKRSENAKVEKYFISREQYENIVGMFTA